MAFHLGAVRTIIHVDLDAFYCAVEEQRDPTLRGQAFAVGARAAERGVVASCSYPARRCGVRSAMSMGLAQRLCPALQVIQPRHSYYRAVSAQVMELLRAFTPQLEQISIDEAFLDVSALVGDNSLSADHEANAITGRTLALEIQRQISEKLGLSCSLGVASNKMVAKIATDCGKTASDTVHSPHAICLVEAGQEAEFLAPLPVSVLWGVGPKLEARLKDLGIDTIGVLSQRCERDLARRFGKNGSELSRHARGIDRREVVTERESKSISSETTYTRDVQEWETLHATLQEQARSVASQLQDQKLQAATIKLKLRWSDFSFSTRQTTLLVATDALPTIENAATSLLQRLWADGAPVRLLGVGVSGLSPARQLGLFDSLSESQDTPQDAAPPKIENEEKVPEAATPKRSEPKNRLQNRHERLLQAVALLEARFGSDVVHLGSRSDTK